MSASSTVFLEVLVPRDLKHEIDVISLIIATAYGRTAHWTESRARSRTGSWLFDRCCTVYSSWGEGWFTRTRLQASCTCTGTSRWSSLTSLPGICIGWII